MYAISSKLYHQLATRLVELAADRGYYSGKFEFEFEGVLCEMVGVSYLHRRRRGAERYVVQ